MSETTTDPTPSEPTHSAGDGFEPITSQEALDQIVGRRVARERAKFADYDEIKAQAAKYQDAASTIDALQKQVAGFEHAREVEGWRAQVAEATGLSRDAVALLAGDSLEELTAHGEALKEAMAARPRGPIMPNAGDRPESTRNPMTEFANQLFRTRN